MTEVLSHSDQGPIEAGALYMKFSELQLPAYNIKLIYPAALASRQKNPQANAVQSIMVGVLADRGFVYQPLKNMTPLRIEVHDFNEYPLYSKEYPDDSEGVSIGLRLSSKTTKIIAQSSSIEVGLGNQDGKSSYAVEAKGVQGWFLRALNLWQMHNGEDMLEIRTEDRTHALNTDGAVKAWEIAGFPAPMFELMKYLVRDARNSNRYPSK
jgi:hypothetical protein